jgi:signal transduction histidine kinase
VSRYDTESAAVQEVLAGGGEMGALMRQIDWSATLLGPVNAWPQSLRTAVSICLNSRYPILIWWGPDYVKLYNDAYRIILGQSKHPRALGAPGREIWPEIWHIIGPMLDSVYHEGRATWSDDQLLLMDRNGYMEEAYFTFSYSPIRDESGGIGGIFTAVVETTPRVLGERRLRTVQELAIEARTSEEAAAEALRILSKNPQDVPLALVYLLDAGGREACLAGASGIEWDNRVCPETVDLTKDDQGAWPLARVATSGQAEVIEDLATRFGALPGGAWTDSPASAMVLPIVHPGQKVPAGLLVLGINPQRVFDSDYRAFFFSLADHLATALTNARAYEEERRRAEALAELDRAKTEFFSNISHEFRTPLTLQLGPLQDVLDGRLGDLNDEQRQALEMVYRHSLRSLKLVNSLLDFSRVEAGRTQAVYEPVDLALLTADLASTFRSTIERAGLRFRVTCSPLSEPVYVDRNMWEQIVLNLLSNAFKFTMAGEISVSLNQTDHLAVLEVKDSGAGIAPEDMQHLFERFYRARNAQARTYEGTGIGLALVQELVKLHGGTIRAASSLEQGSTFTVSLPLGKAHLPAARIAVPRPQPATGLAARSYVEEALHWLPEPDSAGLQHDAAVAVAQAEYGPRILLADDNADMRAYVARILSDRYQVEAVPDGEKALAAARVCRPELVLADVMMPQMDGFSLLRELRADPRTQNVPVILLSARAGEEARVEGLEAGADDYLVKPFNARELAARVAARLEAVRAAERREGAALRQNNARLQLLLELDRAILAARSVPDIAQTAARHLRRGINAVRVSVLLFDFDAGVARFIATDAISESRFGRGTLLPLDVFWPLEANRRGEVGYVEDLAGQPGIHPIQQGLYAEGVHSFASIPLAIGDQLIGSIVISGAELGRPDPGFVDFACQVAVSLAVAIQNARYIEQMAEREVALSETAARLQASREELQALSRHLVDALENERRAIARNLHDEAGQTLTVLKMGLGNLTRTGGINKAAAEQVEELKLLTDSVSIGLHRLAMNLRPVTLDRVGLIPALQQYIDTYQKQTGVQVDLVTVDLGDERFSADFETALYRVVQEALTNVARHARATHVGVIIQRREDKASLIVEDDGTGFSVHEALQSGRLGLVGMRERADMLGGKLVIESAPGQGCTLYLELPAEPAGSG